MARLSTLLTLLSAAVAVSASPIIVRDSPVTLPLARRFNTTGTANIVKADQARAKALKARAQAPNVPPIKTAGGLVFPGINVPVTNQVVIYTATIGVGTPPTNYELIVDTGSSNTWIGANQPYVNTSSSIDTGEEVEVFYGSGFFFGEEWLDTVTLAPDLVIKNQSIGVADLAIGFNGYDGILGFGPDDLTEDTTSDGNEVPTVTDNAFTQGLIQSKVVGVSFEPTNQTSVTNGELTFGGIDYTKMVGALNYVPITTTIPAAEYVGIDQSITYGWQNITILSTTAGITDTGTTLILLASDALAVYQNVTGAVFDENTGLLKITPEQYDNLEVLLFHIGDAIYAFTPNAQIWPRALNTLIGGDPDSIYLVIADIGSPSGEGFDFINGYSFLERFYYIYDSDNSRVGLAYTPYTHVTTN